MPRLKKRDLREVRVDAWRLPNRNGFQAWVDRTFRYSSIVKKRVESGMLESQRFVKDFLQYESPYRGLLLFHGLGSGKTCNAIYATEDFLMRGRMKVVVMVPANIQKNYVNQIKNQCGNAYFSTKRNWEFFDMPRIKDLTGRKEVSDAIKFISDVADVDEKVVRKNKGVWVPNAGSATGTPYGKMSDAQKLAINAQLDSLIRRRYEFINYNGMTRERVNALEAVRTNPFNDKVVVIDEVHNFISNLLGSGYTIKPIYRLLLKAKNCKIILLTGTPIVNNPYEVAAIINLIRGFQTQYTLKFKSVGALTAAASFLERHDRVDHFETNAPKASIDVQLCPEGFRFSDKGRYEVRREDDAPNDKSTIASICQDLACTIESQRALTVFPTSEEEFIERYIDLETLGVQRPLALQRRMIGCISYFSTSGDEFPRLESDEKIFVDMPPRQWDAYAIVRNEEIRKDRQQMRLRGQGGDKLYGATTSYKSASRMCCNFVFPEGIKYDYKKSKKVKKSVQEQGADADPDGGVDAPKRKNWMKNMTAEFMAAYAKLRTGKAKYLTEPSLAGIAPKTSAMLKTIDACKGKCLVYSEFIALEGLTHVMMALEARGYAELRIHKVGGREWQLDMRPEDVNKPKFFRYDPDMNEERLDILVDLFNMADKASATLVPASVLDGFRASTNLRGEIVKVILITQSGAEGLNLKHVRQVHMLEPYWHDVRMQQVIGRAVRNRSHVDLPKEERTVRAYRYFTRLTPAQVEDAKQIKTIDRGMTTDESVAGTAARKHKITLTIESLMKGAAVDCGIYALHNRRAGEGISCLRLPDDDGLAYHPDFEKDYGEATAVKVVKREVKHTGTTFRSCKINGVPYAFDPSGKVLYDLDAYKAGKLVRVGALVDAQDGKYKIVS